MQKRTALEKLDRVCNFNYLKNRMTINNNNNGNITTTKKRHCNVIAGSSFIEKSESKSAPQLPQPPPPPATSPIRISCSLTKLDTHTNDSTNNMEHSALPNGKRRALSSKKTSRINSSLSRRSIAVAPKKSSKSLLLSSMSNKNDSIRNSFIQIKIEQQTEVEENSSYMNKNVKSFIDLENESGESGGHDFNNNINKRSDEQHQQLMHSNGITKFGNYSPYMPLLYNPTTLSEQQQQ